MVLGEGGGATDRLISRLHWVFHRPHTVCSEYPDPVGSLAYIVRLLTDALLRAADRGERVRVLIDDGETLDGDEQSRCSRPIENEL